MPFPLRTPQEIQRRLEASMETELRRVRPDASEAAIARAVRSPRGMIAAILRITAMALYEEHLHLRWMGDQYFPDTAEIEALIRHCSIWGIVRRPATRAIGRATVAGTDGTLVPIGARLVGATAIYVTTTAVTLDDGTAVLELTALDAGADGNAAAGTGLSFESPIAGLDAPVATVDSEGLAGGAEIETPAALLRRLLERIQEPAHGGAFFDYPVWVQNKFPALSVLCLPNWTGLGTVGVAVVMGDADAPRVPTSAELIAIAAEIETQRPVTADVDVFAATLVTIDPTIMVDPFTVAVKAAVQTALKAFFAAEAGIGKLMPKSRMSEAISAATGEYRHELIVPAGDVVPAAAAFPVLGTITWEAPS